MTQVKRRLPAGRAAQLVLLGNRGAGQGQQHHHQAAPQTGDQRPATCQPGAQPTQHGRTEEIIGTWLASRKARDKVMIATKAIGRTKWTWLRKDGSPGRQNRAQLIEALDGSLKRLRTDFVDLYQLHWPDRPMRIFEGLDYMHKEGDSHAIEDILGVLGEFVSQGKVRLLGLSNETPWGVMTFLKASATLGLPRIVSIQNAFNLVNRSFEIGLAEIFHREQVSLLGYSPLGQGYLTGKYEGGALPEGSRKRLFDRLGRYEIGNGPRAISAYVALARKHAIDPAQMALSFATTRPFVTATIIGATTFTFMICSSTLASKVPKSCTPSASGFIAALLNRMSSASVCWRTVSTEWASESPSVTSSGTIVMRSLAATWFNASLARRQAAKTRSPRAAYCRASSSPIPRLVPVMNTRCN